MHFVLLSAKDHQVRARSLIFRLSPRCLQIDLSWPETKIRKCFPAFPGVAAASEVTLEAGQMLFLPAGWFHEVTSFSSAASKVHVAVNYWFHPSDANVTPLPHTPMPPVDCPYSGDYWPVMWNERVRRHSWPTNALVPEAGSAELHGASKKCEAHARPAKRVKL